MGSGKEYYYMFSEGSYSDYCIGGLYKSKQPLTKEWFGQYLKDKLIQKHPEYEEFFQTKEPDIDVLTGEYYLQSDLYEYATQKKRPPYLYESEKYKIWFKAKEEFIKDIKFSNDVVEYALEDGIIEAVEYKEIWCGA